MLATLAVPFDPEAVRVAAQAALETNSRLIVVDAVERPWWPQSTDDALRRARGGRGPGQIKQLVAQMAGLGLEVEHMRIPTAKPVDAVLDLAGERQAGLLVLGPDRSRFRPRLFARIARARAQARALPAVGHRRRPVAGVTPRVGCGRAAVRADTHSMSSAPGIGRLMK